MAVFSCILPGTMVLLLGFFSLLHSWLNAFAEMTQFADRQFYKVSLRLLQIRHPFPLLFILGLVEQSSVGNVLSNVERGRSRLASQLRL